MTERRSGGEEMDGGRRPAKSRAGRQGKLRRNRRHRVEIWRMVALGADRNFKADVLMSGTRGVTTGGD